MQSTILTLAVMLSMLYTTVFAGLEVSRPRYNGLLRKRAPGNSQICLPNYMTLDENDAKAWCATTDLISAKLPNPTPIVAYFIPENNPSATATVTTIPPQGATVWFCHCTPTLTGGTSATSLAASVAPLRTDGVVNDSKRWIADPRMRQH